VDCTRALPVLLRPGMLSQTQLSELCGQAVLSPAEFERMTQHQAAPRASGTLASHYAPAAQVRLMSSQDIRQARFPQGVSIGLWARTLPETLSARVFAKAMPGNPADCARALFAQLREFEALGVTEIWIENPPPLADWDGIRDRLLRAAAPSASK
jgi:L-threonylcarbamoyladenylate synthase